MKAIRCERGSVVLDERAAAPTAGAGEAVVGPTRLAVNAEDAMAVGSEFSGVLGHEFVGRVVEINAPPGHASHARLMGKRVVGSAHTPCGACERCRTGLALHCAHATVLGLRGRDGCFAQRFTIPAASLVALPDKLADDQAIFATSVGRVLHAARMLRVEGKTFVSVLGDGPVALLAAQVMARRNASVRLLGTREENMELCTKWGVKHRAQHEVGRRHDQDIVFDCSGTAETASIALGLVRPRGVVVLMRAFGPGASLPVETMVRDEVQVLGSRGCAVAEAVSELAAGRVDVLSLVARRLRFEDGPQAIRAAGEPGMLKILLDAA